jgi:hypothetical protein
LRTRAHRSPVRGRGLIHAPRSATGHGLYSVALGGVAQSVRAPACHAGGRGFESRRSRPRSRCQQRPFLCRVRWRARFRATGTTSGTKRPSKGPRERPRWRARGSGSVPRRYALGDPFVQRPGQRWNAPRGPAQEVGLPWTPTVTKGRPRAAHPHHPGLQHPEGRPRRARHRLNRRGPACALGYRFRRMRSSQHSARCRPDGLAARRGLIARAGTAPRYFEHSWTVMLRATDRQLRRSAPRASPRPALSRGGIREMGPGMRFVRPAPSKHPETAVGQRC